MFAARRLIVAIHSVPLGSIDHKPHRVGKRFFKVQPNWDGSLKPNNELALPAVAKRLR